MSFDSPARTDYTLPVYFFLFVKQDSQYHLHDEKTSTF